MCQQCLTKSTYYQVFENFGIAIATKEWGDIKPGYWGLVKVNDPYFWTSMPLKKEPKEEDHSSEADDWYGSLSDFRQNDFYLSPHIGHKLIEDMKKVGLKEDNPEIFFINYIVNYIENNPGVVDMEV
jgi:hypothetical protein